MREETFRHEEEPQPQQSEEAHKQELMLKQQEYEQQVKASGREIDPKDLTEYQLELQSPKEHEKWTMEQRNELEKEKKQAFRGVPYEDVLAAARKKEEQRETTGFSEKQLLALQIAEKERIFNTKDNFYWEKRMQRQER